MQPDRSAFFPTSGPPRFLTPDPDPRGEGTTPASSSPLSFDLESYVVPSPGIPKENVPPPNLPRTDGANRSRTTDSAEEYWRFVETPDLSQNRMQEALVVPPSAWPVASTPRGEQNDYDSDENDPRNSRKRHWAGTPNPEEAQRGSARLRLSGTTPTLRTRTLAATEEEIAGPNPWESAGRNRTEDLIDSTARFAPVHVSTPVLSSVHDSRDLTQTPLMANDSGRPPTPHCLDDTPSPPASPIPGRVAGDDSGWARPQTRDDGPQSMDIDEPREEEPAARPRPEQDESARSKGKGKARATSADAEEEAADAGTDEDPRGRWNEQELIEARQQSLRQTLEDRRRAQRGVREAPGQSSSWQRGPAQHTEPNRHDQPRYEQTRHGQGVAGPSGSGGGGEMSRTYYGYQTQEWQLPTTRNGPRGQPLLTRERSEYRPLPNTRAAEYMTQTGRVDESGWTRPETMPQRSPLSRIRGVHRPRSMSPVWEPRTPTRAYEATPFSARGPTSTARGGFQDEQQTRGTLHSRLRTSGENRGEAHVDYEVDGGEDGEILPTMIGADARREGRPTDPPEGGFPRIYRDDPEARLRGMAVDWVREIWTDPQGTSVLLDIFNYQHSDDDTYIRLISEMITAYVEETTGESGFDVVPPEAESRERVRARDLPTTWAIRGLSPRSTRMLTTRGVWSFPGITFMASPRTTPIQSWICALEGYVGGNPDKIRAAAIRVLTEDRMRDWIETMVEGNPDFRGRSREEAAEAVLDSVRVETMQMANGNYVANVFIRPPTRDVREWRRWAAALRERRYPSFTIGTGRVRYVAACSGCHSVAHPTHLCPFTRLQGWNGPTLGTGVFGDRRGGEKRRNTARPGDLYLRDRPSEERDGRGRRDRRGAGRDDPNSTWRGSGGNSDGSDRRGGRGGGRGNARGYGNHGGGSGSNNGGSAKGWKRR